MKIASWNVNSVRARLSHLTTWLDREKPDFLCLQELKCQEADYPFMDVQAVGYQSAIVGQKAYNGVALLSKYAVQVIATTIGDEQARYIEVEASGIRIINIYAPNGNPIDTEKFPYKLDWLSRLEVRMKQLLKEEVPFLVTGDFNIIPEPIDAHTPAAWVQDALFQPQSRAFYRRFINLGLTDAFRVFHKGPEHFTFWDYQAAAWAKNDGIRIDLFLLSPQLTDRLVSCNIDKQERGRENPSDHVPIILELRD